MAKGRNVPPRPTLADRAVIAEAAQALRQRPGLWVLRIGHDDGCPTLRTQREDDCTCAETTAEIVHHNDLVKGGRR